MKFDAKKAEREYITTQTSYRKLAEKYEVDYTTVANYGNEHCWVDKRNEYQSNVHQKAIEKAMEKDIDRLATLKSATDMAIGKVWTMIEDCEDENAMRTCVAALKDLNMMQRDLHGLLSKKDELTLRQDTGDTGESGVVYIPPLAAESDTVVTEGETDA